MLKIRRSAKNQAVVERKLDVLSRIVNDKTADIPNQIESAVIHAVWCMLLALD